MLPPPFGARPLVALGDADGGGFAALSFSCLFLSLAALLAALAALAAFLGEGGDLDGIMMARQL